ncbi:hypothetical protein FISHEDRAFT_52191 [Fistulina hepatica ATCC 64428]|nr:hypothetical protein FISHEDRAFT_52191 [Fistulina hepatica ATCC 64428]
MPLKFVDASVDSKSLAEERYIVFYSSIVGGRMWCPDCRAVEGLVKQTFGNDSASPSATVVYVGNVAEWKSPSNTFRSAPWKVTNVPTILKMQNGKEVDRLGDDVAIQQRLSEFVKA